MGWIAGKVGAGIQISMVCTALGWMAVEASFWPANLGARAMVIGFVKLDAMDGMLQDQLVIDSLYTVGRTGMRQLHV